MFKLGSRLLITAVFLAMAMSLSGNEAGAQQQAPILETSVSDGSGTGGLEPIGTPDSGEPDIGQTRDRPDGGASGAGEEMALSEVRYATSGWNRWIAVMWVLRYLGLGN